MRARRPRGFEGGTTYAAQSAETNATEQSQHDAAQQLGKMCAIIESANARLEARVPRMMEELKREWEEGKY